MMKEIIVFLSVVYLFSSCKSLEISNGNCNTKNVTVVQNFNISAYMGLWYEIKRYCNIFEFGDCVTAEYSLRNSSIVNVKNTEKILNNNAISSIQGHAYLENPTSSEGKLKVVFQKAPNPAPYWVVYTDYDSVSIVWSCEDLTNHKIEFLWVLSRKRSLTDEQNRKVQDVFNRNGIGELDFYVTNQTQEACL